MPAAGPWRGTLGIIGVSQSDLIHPSKPGIEIPVLTPVLYSQFARFQTHREAFDKLCFDVPASENLLLISDHTAFLGLLSRAEQSYPKSLAPHSAGWIRRKTPLYAALFHGTVTYPHPNLSKLDMLIPKEGDNTSKRRYCRNVTSLLLSHRLAFGGPKSFISMDMSSGPSSCMSQLAVTRNYSALDFWWDRLHVYCNIWGICGRLEVD